MASMRHTPFLQRVLPIRTATLFRNQGQDKIPVDAALLLAYIELIERHNVFDQPVIKGTTR